MSDLAEKLAGKFIVIDGPDGAGKTTQLELLADYLRTEGVVIVETHDPGGTAIGERVREILLDKSHAEMTVGCEIMLYMASRTQLMGEVIAPALEAGKCALCDRWVSSTIAYQVAGGADLENIENAYESAMLGARPDLTIILDLPADVGLARSGKTIGHDRMEAKGLQFHDKVRELFLQQAEESPNRFAVLDAEGSIEDVQARLREALGNWRPEESA
ncbi:MAG: dTMP kinase [Planctomycetota bacterium]|jgi:dTMP kinase